MPKKITLFLFGFIFLFSFHLAFAVASINEVFYSTTSKQWIEVYNNSDTAIDITKYKILDNGASVNGHVISAIAGGSNFIEPYGFAVVAKVPDDFGTVSFQLFKSSLGIKPTADTADTVILRDTSGGASDNTVLVSNNSAIDGNSLQFINNSWQSAIPTPGQQNSNLIQETASTNNSSSASSSTTTETKNEEVSKVKTKIEGKVLAFVGIPVGFNATTTGHMNEILSYGKYFWNFGDGDSKEIDTNNKAKFTHTFFYEGEYTVMLEYYQNYSSEEPDAIDKMTIKVIPANVSISNVGDEKDFFIEITNNTLYDADISKWILLSNQKSFTLPRNMILESKKKIILSPKITGFSFSDKDSLKLLNPQRETMFDYSGVLKPIETQTKNLVSKISKLNTNESREAVKPPFGGFTAKLADAEMPTDNLLANASESDIPLAESSNFNYSIFGLFAFLGISGSTAYFIRNRNRKIIGEANGSDFEILDE